MNFLLDIYGGRLIADVNAPQTITDLTMVCRDVIPVQVTVVKINPDVGSGGNLYIPMDLPAGYALFFGAKLPAALDGVFLISSAVWTGAGSGVYNGTLSLTEQPLLDAVGPNTPVSLLAEFSTFNGGNKSFSTQFNLRVIPAVARGNEPANILVSISGNTRWALVIDDNGNIESKRLS